MTQWNIIIISYVAVLLTIDIVYRIRNHKDSLLSFLRKESIESLERKLYGFDQSINATIITDENGIISSVNDAMVAMFGWKEKELVNSTLQKIVPERFWVAHSQGMIRAKGKEMEDRKFCLQATKKDKTEIPIRLMLRKKKIKNEFFYVAILSDVTKEVNRENELKAEIAELQRQNEFLNKGEELGNTGSWIWDLRSENDTSETKLYTSPNYNRIMGIGDTVFHSAKFLKSRVWDEDEAIVNSALEKAFRGEPYDITYRMNRSSDFKVIYIRSIVKPVKDENGTVVFLYGSTRLLQTLNIVDAINKQE